MEFANHRVILNLIDAFPSSQILDGRKLTQTVISILVYFKIEYSDIFILRKLKILIIFLSCLKKQTLYR